MVPVDQPGQWIVIGAAREILMNAVRIVDERGRSEADPSGVSTGAEAEVDVADLESEQEHAYELLGARDGEHTGCVA